MKKSRTTKLSLFSGIGLCAMSGVAFFLIGSNWLTISLAVVGGTTIFWSTKRPRPKNELPNAAVSCCHYLGDTEDPPQP